MASLRKACRNCTASKRKCVIQVPKCTRCAQRGLQCTYDLEPLSAPVAQLRETPQLSWNPSASEAPGYCLIRRVETRPSNIDPAICSPGHESALEVLRLGYQSIPSQLRSGKPALFVHSKLQLHGNRNHLDPLVKSKTGIDYEDFMRLVGLNIEALPIKEALTALQALTVHLATLALDGRNVQGFLDLLVEWAQALLASAQTQMPPEQSPWQTWLFGESVRRTIVMSYALAMAVNSFTNGYCTYWMFLESLPFDRRAGLWMAESPQAWIANAGVKYGEQVGEQLISFHEFGLSHHKPGDDFRGDAFLSLVAVGHGYSYQS
ncbi:Zn(II)2Cys6 transcription factor domain-containing protein [Aspergillus mulundensis]|uniref:Zn(2)-C6 fungal-type domain-containing protein n=1 Tax=Aspergillus mulundensis TaxID=1810919 RepID=A0A3D8T4Z2_9EURO|nr:Uncharacterized protein DSM5745_00921 [Aspergillus mulundensis]RDW93599.1 Uncharacterized protein DSM5745_00921 [Aspergillus mulundensis]